MPSGLCCLTLFGDSITSRGFRRLYGMTVRIIVRLARALLLLGALGISMAQFETGAIGTMYFRARRRIFSGLDSVLCGLG